MKRPCLDCGRPTDGTRCPQHAGGHEAARTARAEARRKTGGRRRQYGGDYRARAAAIRENATVCWICAEGPRTDDPFTADHYTPAQHGGADSPLLPAHRSCNVARGNRTRHMTVEQQAADAAATLRRTRRRLEAATVPPPGPHPATGVESG